MFRIASTSARQLLRPALISRHTKSVTFKSLLQQQSPQGIRFNSTTPSAATETITETVTEAAKKFDTTLAFDDSASTVTEQVATTLTSDQFGYLQSIGLVDGWWPSDIIQRLLEAVHVCTGLPWWATIAVTTVACRALLFPLFMSSSDTMARSQEIMPQSKALRKEINLATVSGDTRTRQIKSLQLSALNKKHGVKHSRMFLSPMTQVVYGFGSFFGIRDMANVPVQGFQDQGTAWFPDLSQPDSYIGLQLISACCYSLSFKLGGETAINQFGDTMKKVFTVLPFVSVLVTYNMSSAVLIYFTANGFCSILQGRLLRSNTFRKWAKIHPMPDPSKVKDQNKGMIENFSETWAEMQQNQNAKFDNEAKAKKATELQFARAQSSKVIIKKRK